jgi:hypothetical protein
VLLTGWLPADGTPNVTRHPVKLLSVRNAVVSVKITIFWDVSPCKLVCG